MLEAVKKDLDELSTVVKEEAVAAGEVFGLNQADSTVGAMKKSFSTFLGQMSEVLVPPMEDEEAEAVMITKDGVITLTGFAKHLAELQANDATYLNEPDDTLASQYQRWLEVVEQDQFTESRLTKQLTMSQILNEKYLNLVPSKVAHMDFWKRYLFKKALLEDAVANAELVAKKAAETETDTTKATVVPEKLIVQTEQPKATAEEEELKMWEADLGVQNIELSEEEQARLLEEYEKEIKEREGKPETTPKKPAPATKKQPQQQGGNQPSKSAQGKQQQQQQNNSKTTKTGAANKGNKGKNNKQQQQQPIQPVAKKEDVVEKKEESTSDESWEKDFDDLDQK